MEIVSNCDPAMKGGFLIPTSLLEEIDKLKMRNILLVNIFYSMNRYFFCLAASLLCRSW